MAAGKGLQRSAATAQRRDRPEKHKSIERLERPVVGRRRRRLGNRVEEEYVGHRAVDTNKWSWERTYPMREVW